MKCTCLCVFLFACAERQAPIARCTLAPNQQAFTVSVPADLMASIRNASYRPLPPSFQFGTATAAFQIESNISGSDWTAWAQTPGRIFNGDKASNGPASELHVADDIARMQSLGTNSYRLGVELSRLFPTRDALFADPPTPDPDALLYYNGLLDSLRAAGISPMLTLQHFSLPLWLEGGVLSAELVSVLERFAGWAALSFGDRVDYWITINEPSGLATGGYVQGAFPPGHVLDLPGFSAAYAAMAEAHARMYDAIVQNDRVDADGDYVSALVSFATHNRLWLPVDPTSAQDVAGARRVRYISNLVLVEAASCGNYDANFDEKLDAGDRVNDARLKDRLDFIALNYYGTAGVAGLPIEPFRGVPLVDFPTSGRAKSDLGWDLAPEGLLGVLHELLGYGLPVIITENGVADAADVLRPKFLVDSMLAVQAARAEGIDVAGYYHWSLLDNFEWAFGFCPRFGLYAVDFSSPDKNRSARASADVYRQIIQTHGVPDELRHAFSYGTPTSCAK